MRCNPCTVRARAARRTSSSARPPDSRGAGRTRRRSDRIRCNARCRCRAAVLTCVAHAAHAAAGSVHPGRYACRCSWSGLNLSAWFRTETSPRPAPGLHSSQCPCTQPAARPRPSGPPAWPRPIHRDGFAPSRTAPVSGPARPWPTGSPHLGPGRGSRAARRSYPWPYELHMNDSVAEWMRVERRGRCESLWRWTLPVVLAHTAANSSAGISVARRLSSRDADFDRWQDRVEAGCPSLAGPSASLPACVWLLDLGRVWRRRGQSRWTRPESGRTDRHASCSKPRAELRAYPSMPTGCRHLTCGIERCLAALRTGASCQARC